MPSVNCSYTHLQSEALRTETRHQTPDGAPATPHSIPSYHLDGTPNIKFERFNKGSYK
jgi:hypothetical protein